MRSTALCLAGLFLLVHAPMGSAQEPIPPDTLPTDEVTASGEDRPHRAARDGPSARLAVRGIEYNRVEGLRVRVGPILETGGRRPLRLRSHLVWRTEGRAPLAADRLGYRVVAEQALTEGGGLRVGGGVRSTIDPIEDRGLSGKENSWSTLLFTNDHRDHFETRGWNVFARAASERRSLEATADLRSERHGTVGAGDPRTIFRSERSWRPQPAVAQGSLRWAGFALTADTRDQAQAPTDGWLVEGRWRHGLSGNLDLPAGPSADGGNGAASALGAVDPRFRAAGLDVRRYQPVGGSGTLALRASLDGSVDREPLPPQFQRALGGPGSLPGHSVFAADCGARTTQLTRLQESDDVTLFPAYGCDRVALFQAEYRGPLSLDLGFGSSGGSGKEGPSGGTSWSVFFNAGRGWAVGDPADGPGRVDSPTLYDVGLGLLVRSGGVFWAVPLNGETGRGTLTIRLERRF